MSMESGFFDAIHDSGTGKYDREYSSSQFMELFSLFFTSGIFANYGKEFAVEANGTMNVMVGTGFAFIDGAWLKNTEDYQVTIVSNSTSNKRIDGIFLRKSTIDRKCDVVYRAGDVTPINSNVTKELLVCKINVESGTSALTQSNVVDMRATSDCGFVAAAIQQLTVSELYAQFTQQFTEWMEAEQQDFTTWFNNIKNQLTSDAAGNLQLQIDNLVTQSNGYATKSELPVYTYDESSETLSITLPTL